jgi:DNA-directed RNA polymerase subunit H (RpoH/RPB5)
MFQEYKGFVLIHPLDRPMRILNEKEKEECLNFYKKSGNNIHKILSSDNIVKDIEAKVGDIICILRLSTEIFRLVV